LFALAGLSVLPVASELLAKRPADAAHSAGLVPDSISGVTGQSTVVALQMDVGTSGKVLGSYSVRITWDSTIARLDSVRPGAFGTPLVNYANGGDVRLTQVNGTGMAGVFSLAQLHFRFVSDAVGARAPITVTFTDLVATDFTDLRVDLATISGITRVLGPPVVVHFSPDSMHERVNGRPRIDLTADLSAANGVALGSYVAAFTWDTTVMLLDSVRAGDFVAPTLNQVNAGELRLSAADGIGRGGAPFSLARLYFRYLGESFPRLSNLALSVSEVRAAGTFANLISGLTARSGKAVVGGVFRGDIDIDGSIAALDAQLILQGVVGLGLPDALPGLPHGDADCGGTLQAKDAQIVLNQVVGNVVGQFCVATIR
ncbi:MAG TPA: hypothetical protein VEB19_18725, partial [Gemmatimonadaceae bacterium]|nr:hypothetical protein [Gemmatimonadaceae bacterium]